MRGLQANGFEVHCHLPMKAEHGDLLVIWNRYADNHETAQRFEQQGGTVIVAENAYIGVDRSDRCRYALAHGAHNGAGCWAPAGASAFEALNIEVKPWRVAGEHILVCPNRSFGMPGMVMPVDWVKDVTARLRRFTQRPIRVRPHPGNELPKVPLEADLASCWAVVIWSSSVGVEALVRGIPVHCEAPYWICKEATRPIKAIDQPCNIDPMPALHAMAWAQWHVDKISSGAAFAHLLNRPQAFAGGVPSHGQGHRAAHAAAA